MPIKKTTKNGKPAYKWGNHGKAYTGPEAKQKAAKQAAAAHANGFHGDDMPKSVRKALKHPDVPGAGAKKRAHLSPTHKSEAVMQEFERGTLRSGSGAHVKSKRQAEAIAEKVSGKDRRRRGKRVAVDAMTFFRAQARAQQNTVNDIFQTADSFENFLTRVGVRTNNGLAASGYDFNLITRNRLLLEAAYRGSWIAGAVVDSIAEDMTRAGIDINVAKDEGDVKRVRAGMSRLQIWQSLCQTIKNGRLYGGAIGVIQIRGQDLSTPLDVETIRKGQFEGIIPFDRWAVNPIITQPIDSGPEMGLPKYYQIVNSPDELSPSYYPGAYDGQMVHFSRCIRITGIDLPYFQAITEMMWGESVLERLWDRLLSFDNATMSSAQLIDRANLRTVGIDGLREILAAGNVAAQGLYAQFDMMRELQNNEGLTLLDKNDSFQSTAYSFAGLSDMMLQFGQQLAGATGIPLVRLFGQSPAGLSATGESDMRMYYDNINARQESKLRNPLETLVKILWYSEIGKPPPDDMTWTFNPLWQMSATDKANNAKTTTETIIGAYESGVTDRKTTLLELRDASIESGVFKTITDEDVNEASDDEPPLPDMDPIAPDPAQKPDEKAVPTKSFDSKKRFWQFWKRKRGVTKEN